MPEAKINLTVDKTVQFLNRWFLPMELCLIVHAYTSDNDWYEFQNIKRHQLELGIKVFDVKWLQGHWYVLCDDSTIRVIDTEMRIVKVWTLDGFIQSFSVLKLEEKNFILVQQTDAAWKIAILDLEGNRVEFRGTKTVKEAFKIADIITTFDDKIGLYESEPEVLRLCQASIAKFDHPVFRLSIDIKPTVEYDVSIMDGLESPRCLTLVDNDFYYFHNHRIHKEVDLPVIISTSPESDGFLVRSTTSTAQTPSHGAKPVFMLRRRKEALVMFQDEKTIFIEASEERYRTEKMLWQTTVERSTKFNQIWWKMAYGNRTLCICDGWNGVLTFYE